MSDVRIDLSGVERAITEMGTILERDIQQVSVEVGEVRADVATTSQELKDLRQRFEEYAQQSERLAEYS
ncbi:hypothetical protein [Brachybacterium muris]|uniref:hypothetical protein n=1 Tax=Brachybacterium muris TaxID=219301 RepID=UPI0035E7353E